jgi:hypothetical protein
VNVDVLENDPSGPSLEVTEVTDGANGTVVIEDDGTVTYTPETGFSGIDTFTYTATDGDGQTITQTVTVTVTPVGADDTATTPSNTPVNVDVLANDPSGPSLEVTEVTDGANGTVVIEDDGTVTYTPEAGFSGTDSFTYTACDDADQCVTHTVTVTVTPVGVDDVAVTEPNTPVNVDVLANDPSAPSLTVTEVTDGANGTVVIEDDGTVTYTPVPGFSGTDSFTYTACDAEDQCVTQTVTVTVTATGADDTATTPTNTPVNVDVLDNDPAGPSSTVTEVSEPANGTVVIEDDGTVTYTPETGFSGIDTFTYTACDAEEQCYTQTVTVTVTPVGVDDTATTPTNTAVNVDVLDNDPSAPSLEVTAVTDGANGTVVIEDDGTVTYTPESGFSGIDTFTYTATDGDGQTITQSVTVTVTPVGADDTATTPTNTPVNVDVLANDPSGPSLEVTEVTDGANGTVAIELDGTVTYTPATGFSGIDTFTYTATDGDGQTITQSVTVTVTPVGADDTATTPTNTPVNVDVLANDPSGPSLEVTEVTDGANGTVVIEDEGTVTYTPEEGFSGIDTFTYTACDLEDQCVTHTVTVTVTPVGVDDTATTLTNTAVNVDVLDNDPSGPSLEVTEVTDGANGTVVIEDDGTVTYTPESGFSGIDTFTYTATDGDGQTITQSVTVTVTPVGVDDTATTPTNTPVNVDVLSNDPAGPSLTVTAVTQPSNGTVVIEDDGTVTYTPDPGFSGIDTFTYTATDEDGQTITQTVTVTVTPVGVDDTASTPSNTPVNVDVLDNDPSGPSLEVTEVTNGDRGVVTIEDDGTVTYTPDPGFSGVDTFTYTACDDAEQCVTQSVTVTVTPVGADDTATTPGEAPVNVDVLANDPSGPSLEVTEVTDGANGTVTIEDDGTVTYTAEPGFSGTDTFTYTACDVEDQCVTQSVTVTVTPVGADDTASTPSNTPVNVDVLANDPSGPSLEVTEVTDGANGTVVIEDDGTVTYTPAEGFSGIDTFTYTACDLEDQCVTQTVTVTVTPVGVDDTATTPTNTPVSVDVLANDPSGPSLSVTETTNGTFGVVTIEDDGTVTYTPDPGFSGTDTFTYTACDDAEQCVTHTVTVTVTPVGADDTATTPGEAPVNVDVLANDPSGPSLEVTEVTDGANGTVVIEDDGTVTYTADPGFSGTDTFTYTACDDAEQCVTQSVTVTVTPVGADDTATTPTNTPVNVDVLDNDPSGPSLEVTEVTDGANGTVVIEDDGTVTYTPATGFSGIDTFTYTATDEDGQTITQSVTVTVTPVGVDDTATTPGETPVNVDVLANDPSGPSLEVTEVTDGANGTVVIEDDGTVTYTPDPGFSGTDTFTYTACDDAEQCVAHTVTVTVTPVGADDTASTPSNTR